MSINKTKTKTFNARSIISFAIAEATLNIYGALFPHDMIVNPRNYAGTLRLTMSLSRRVNLFFGFIPFKEYRSEEL